MPKENLEDKTKGKNMPCWSKRCLGEYRHFVYVAEDADKRTIYVCRKCGRIEIENGD